MVKDFTATLQTDSFFVDSHDERGGWRVEGDNVVITYMTHTYNHAMVMTLPDVCKQTCTGVVEERSGADHWTGAVTATRRSQ